MNTVTVTADVYCTRGEGNPAYRVYIDGDLLTERNWAWPAYEIYIRENLIVNVEAGEHQLDIVDCSNNNVFYLKNVTVNGIANNGGVFTV
jgi:hypothetical protein